MIAEAFLACALALTPAASYSSPKVPFVPLPLVLVDHLRVFKFLREYKEYLGDRPTDAKALVMGFHEKIIIPLLEVLRASGFDTFGISHNQFVPIDRYVRGEYDALPFAEEIFALIVAPELHVWHLQGSQVRLINDKEMAFELSRVIKPGGYFLANLNDLHAFAMNLVHAGFSRMEMKFGRVEVWQKDLDLMPNPNMDLEEETVKDWIHKYHKDLTRWGFNLPDIPKKIRGKYRKLKSAA